MASFTVILSVQWIRRKELLCQAAQHQTSLLRSGQDTRGTRIRQIRKRLDFSSENVPVGIVDLISPERWSCGSPRFKVIFQTGNILAVIIFFSLLLLSCTIFLFVMNRYKIVCA